MANFRLGKRVTLISFTKPKIYLSQDKIKQKPDVGTMIYPTPCL